MVIGVLVDIERCKGVERIREGKSLRDCLTAKNREEVCCSNDSVEMENGGAAFAGCIRLLCNFLNNPHSRIFVW